MAKLKLPGYTPSNGIEILKREDIRLLSIHRYGLKINNDQIFVTTGSSGAFLLTFLSVLNQVRESQFLTQFIRHIEIFLNV